MNDTLYSPNWYRVAKLNPCLRNHVSSHRHHYRSITWYVLQDMSSGRNHRISLMAYQLVGLMDGERTIQQIWDHMNERYGAQTPSQEDVVQLLSQLSSTELIQCDVTPDLEPIFQRHQKQQQQNFIQRFQNPMAQKIPLWDPDRFLGKSLPWVRCLFHKAMAFMFLFAMLSAALVAATHWSELLYQFKLHSFSPYNLAMIVLLYPLIKLLHELGHGYAAKLEGGEVHEMGVMFLVFVPIPYVDVSTSSTFRSKYKRMLVGAAGILVELWIAALALFLWVSVEPGLVRDIAFNALLIGGISSLFFNGNPLLRFDGYYVLSDAIEIPNLYRRSYQYLGYLTQRYLFSVKGLSSPVQAPGEAMWFVTYSLLSLFYRMAVLWVIIVFLVDTLWVVGVLLALWMVLMQIIVPLGKGLVFVVHNPLLDKQRSRVVFICISIISIVSLLLTVVPVPSSTLAQGVVWLPDDARIRAGTDGFIKRVLGKPYSDVAKDVAIIEVEDPLLGARVKVLKARLKELNTQYTGHWSDDRVQATIFEDEIAKVEAELLHAQQRADNMIIRSGKSGKLLINDVEDLPGRYVRKGEVLGYVVDDSIPMLRVLVNQDQIGQIRQRTLAIEVRFAGELDRSYTAEIIREIPQASNHLPSAALSTAAGGLFPVDPRDQEGLTTLDRFFQFDIKPVSDVDDFRFGSRVYARFDHGTETLITILSRQIHQLFLRRFGV